MILAEEKGSSMTQLLAQVFYDQFKAPCEALSHAPGRVNLIGEHTDYNDGFVLPMALDRGISVAARRRRDRRLRIYSPEYSQIVELDLNALRREGPAQWYHYAAGMHHALRQDGYNVVGADMAVLGNLPKGAGLSSSAALELAVGRAACALGGWSWDPVAMALLAQKAESEFVGVKCGIMDQFAVALAEPHSALFLDCRTLERRSIPIRFEDAVFVVVDSGVHRELSGSRYNERASECRQAVEELARVKPGLESLRDVDLSMLKRVEASDSLWMRRARHVVGENARVHLAVQALEQGDQNAFGRLMKRSQGSLRADFDVSCPELDTLVRVASRAPGCLGARLTGAGFGGCTVNLVRKEELRAFGDNVRRDYRDLVGKEAQVHVFRPGEAVRLIEN